MSYYLKGSLVGLVLDARIVLATGGARSLDHVMRRAIDSYGGAHGFTEPQFRALVHEVAPALDAAWLDAAIDTTAPLDWAPVQEAYGLNITRSVADGEGPKATATPSGSASLPRLRVGCVLKEDGGRLLVAQVLRDSPAYAAGLQVDDELVAVGDRRLSLPVWGHWAQLTAPGAPVSLLLARHGRLKRLAVTPLAPEPRITGLCWDAAATPAQLAARARWLVG